MKLLIEWSNGKKTKINIGDDKKEEVSSSLKNPWVNLILHDQETGEYWYMFHAKKASFI